METLSAILTIHNAALWRSPQYDDVIKWKHFSRYWSFVRGIHLSPVNSPHKGRWHGALMFSLICAWINSGVRNRDDGDLRHHRAPYDVTVMILERQVFIELLLIIDAMIHSVSNGDLFCFPDVRKYFPMSQNNYRYRYIELPISVNRINDVGKYYQYR